MAGILAIKTDGAKGFLAAAERGLPGFGEETIQFGVSGRVIQLAFGLSLSTRNQAKNAVVSACEISGAQAGSTPVRSYSSPVPGYGPKPPSAGMRYQ
jgi:hypothetical protein